MYFYVNTWKVIMNMHAICKLLFCTLCWSIGFILVGRVQNLILHPCFNPFSFNRVHFYVKGANSYVAPFFAPFFLRVYHLVITGPSHRYEKLESNTSALLFMTYWYLSVHHYDNRLATPILPVSVYIFLLGASRNFSTNCYIFLFLHLLLSWSGVSWAMYFCLKTWHRRHPVWS